MKKISAGIFLAFVVFQAQSQALQKGNVDIHLGVGFGIYSFTSNDFEDNTGAGVPGLFSLGVAYQLSDKWSLGINYERNGFVTDPDSNNRAVSNNVGLVGGFNFVNSEKNVLHVNLEAGYSTFRYDDFKDEDYVIGTGSQIQLGAGWKHYFGGVMGMYMNFSVPFFNYSQFKNSEGEQLVVRRTNIFGITTESRDYSITMNGVNFRIGLLVKL
ncbi:MAG: hypothetical protein RIC15_02230 [Vicingaceae bacterium]